MDVAMTNNNLIIILRNHGGILRGENGKMTHNKEVPFKRQIRDVMYFNLTRKIALIDFYFPFGIVIPAHKDDMAIEPRKVGIHVKRVAHDEVPKMIYGVFGGNYPVPPLNEGQIVVT